MKEDITDMLPSRHVQSYSKRPDGTTVVPWSCGQLVVWYATCPNTLATSYNARLHVLPARLQLLPKRGKSTSMPTLAKHTSLRQWPLKHGAFGPKTFAFVKEIRRRVRWATGEEKAISHLLERLSVEIQRGNVPA